MYSDISASVVVSHPAGLGAERLIFAAIATPAADPMLTAMCT